MNAKLVERLILSVPLFVMPANPAVQPWDIYSSIQIISDLWKASILPTSLEVEDI